MDKLGENNADPANQVLDSVHVVVNLDQNVIALCSETGEIRKLADSSNDSQGHFLRKYGASKRKRQRKYEDSSIWLYDANEEDLEDEESKQIKVAEHKSIEEHEPVAEEAVDISKTHDKVRFAEHKRTGKLGCADEMEDKCEGRTKRKVAECKSIEKSGHVDREEDRYGVEEKASYDHGKSDQDQPRLPCTTCGESFRSAEMYTHHKCIDTTKNKSCELCNFKYITTKQYHTHLQKHIKSRTSLQCPLCKKMFKKRDYLMVHLRSHSRHRLYQCPHCDKEFIHFNQFRTHELALHVDVKPVQLNQSSQSKGKECGNQEKGINAHGKEMIEHYDKEGLNGEDDKNTIHDKGTKLDGVRLEIQYESQSYCEQSKGFSSCVTPNKRRKLSSQESKASGM